MTRQPSDDFDLLLDDIDAEAVAEGPAAMRDLRALQVKYRLINLLIERRHTLRWTQKQLAVHSGIGQGEISKIERGRKSPTLDTYTRLVMALDLDEDILVTGKIPAGAARRGRVRDRLPRGRANARAPPSATERIGHAIHSLPSGYRGKWCEMPRPSGAEVRQ